MIGKEKAGESSKSRVRAESTTSHRSRSRDDRGEKSKSANQNFAPHVKDLIQVTIRFFCQFCFKILQLVDNRSAEEEHDLGTGEGRQLQVREGLGLLHQHVQEAGSGQLFIFEGWFYEDFVSRLSIGQLKRSWSI